MKKSETQQSQDYNVSTLGFNTQAAKVHLDREKSHRSLTTPIIQSTIYAAASGKSHSELLLDRSDKFYTRIGNPTLTEAAKKIALLEGAEKALVFGSGMGAITSSLLTVLKSGDHAVVYNKSFAHTVTFMRVMASTLGIETDFVDATNKENIAKAIRHNTKLIYIDTPTNPLLEVVDIRMVSSIAREHKLHFFVDNTFATPFLQRPLESGATLVLHSGTKGLGGHHDIMCGAAAGSREIIERIRETQLLLGTTLDPNSAWLLLRGIKTLGIRVQKSCENALAIARYLQSQKGISQVNYPWLENSPYYEVARRQMTGAGAVVTFEVEKGLQGSRAFVDALQLIPTATSLGGVETVIEIPYDLDWNEKEMGEAAKDTDITPGMIRLAVGIEDSADLIEDLNRGLRAAGSVTRVRETA